MEATIAIEDDLEDIKQELRENNYSLVDLEEADLDRVNAVLISGQDENVMGMMDTITEAPVINVQGMTASEVKDELDQKIKKLNKQRR
ncbi:MAG: YkuS family protein [Bacillota bacterium]